MPPYATTDADCLENLVTTAAAMFPVGSRIQAPGGRTGTVIDVAAEGYRTTATHIIIGGAFAKKNDRHALGTFVAYRRDSDAMITDISPSRLELLEEQPERTVTTERFEVIVTTTVEVRPL